MDQKNYVSIQGWMVSELGLSGDDLIIFAIIYGFTQDGSSECWSSLDYFQQWTGKKRDAVIRSIERLVAKGIVAKRKRNGATSALKVAVFHNPSQNATGSEKSAVNPSQNTTTSTENNVVNPSQNTTGVVAKCDGSSRILRPNNKTIIKLKERGSAGDINAAEPKIQESLLHDGYDKYIETRRRMGLVKSL